jgi:thiol:disulfide interchange protein
MGSAARTIVTVAGFLFLFAPSATCQTEEGHASFYTVAEYDEARDPAVDLEATIERAQTEGKRILLEVGGVWCGWCKLLDQYIHDQPTVSEKLADGFLIMKVNWSSGNRNEEFLGQYPSIRGYPHIFVLEKDGTLLHSQSTGELEEGRSYNLKAVQDFLDKWAPVGTGAVR